METTNTQIRILSRHIPYRGIGNPLPRYQTEVYLQLRKDRRGYCVLRAVGAQALGGELHIHGSYKHAAAPVQEIALLPLKHSGVSTDNSVRIPEEFSNRSTTAITVLIVCIGKNLFLGLIWIFQFLSKYTILYSHE